MKWYFALKSGSNRAYEAHVKAAVNSAIANTSLYPHFIYDGEPDHLTKWMEDKGVKVIYHRVSFYDDMIRYQETENYQANIAAGAFLRVEIPTIDLEDEYAIYTDCDVIFLKDPDIHYVRPKFFACAPEKDINNTLTEGGNTGVMIMNLPNLRKVHDRFVDFIRSSMPRFSAFDQGAYKTFFHEHWENLDPSLNWKPYWGFNPNAQILHFHGPKFDVIESFMRGEDPKHINFTIAVLFRRDEIAYRRYLKIFKRYYE